MQAENRAASYNTLVLDHGLDDAQRVTLCEVLDRVLNKGVVLAGSLLISVADVELIFLGLQVVLTSVETARVSLPGPENVNHHADAAAD